MANELCALYDELKKGIIVLADEMELSEIDNLGKKLYESQTRPFCIVASRRITTGTKQHMLNTLSDNECDKLIELYSRISPSDVNKNEKLANIDNALPKEHMVPLFIALYFLEKDFNGVEGYVSKTLQFCQSDQEKKVLAYTALLNIYNQFAHLPNSFAVFLSGLEVNPKLRYLKEKSYAQSVLLDESNNCIKTKHYLISEEILRQIAIQLYGMSPDSNFRTYLHSFAMDFVDDYFRFLAQYGCRYKEIDNDILKGLFVEKDSDDDSKFSKLIIDIGLNENSEIALKKIATVSEGYAKRCRREEDLLCLNNAIAHFYGHLGRFYRNEQNFRKNYEESLECAKKSIEHMENGNGNDPYIYHMCGEAYRKYTKTKSYYLRCSDFSYDEFCKYAQPIEELFLIGNKMYDRVIECGQLQHGYLSQLEMYLQFVGDMYYEDGKDKRWALSPEKETIYLCDIHNLINSLYELELDEASKQRYDELVNEFQSGVYRKEDSIAYYSGMVDRARSANNQELLSIARFGLLYERLRKWKQNPGNPDDSKKIMSLLDDICQGINISAGTHENRRMSYAYNMWLYFARLNSKSIQEGIVIAERWKTLCEKLKSNNPRPYYNLYVLEYLNMYEGFASSYQKAEEYRVKCYEKAVRSNGIFGKIDTVRDYLIQGRGMGRLYPRIDRNKEPDASCYVKVEGAFERVVSKKGFISISGPSQWKPLEAKFSLNNKISLKEDFCSHKVAFYAAFTYEQIVANNNIVADISSGESLEQMYSSIKTSSFANDGNSIYKATAPEKNRSSWQVIPFNTEESVFYPSKIITSNNLKKYLNGILENGNAAGFDISELERLGVSPDSIEEAADKIINSKIDCGLPVICCKKPNGKYRVLISQSFAYFDELMASRLNTEPEKESKDATDSLATNENPAMDYSFLKDAEVSFKFKGQKKQYIIGSFEYEGVEYSGKLKCASAKDCKELFSKGHTKAKVITPGKTSILNPIS